MGTSAVYQLLSLLYVMKAFICSALLAVASAHPQLLTRGGFGHGVVGHGLVGRGVVGHGVVGHGVVAHAPVAVAHPVVAHPVAHTIARPVVHAAVAHPVAHAVGYVDDLAEPSPYNYQYAVSDDYSGANFAQSEANDGTGAVSGSYSVNLPDGRIQHVNYNANDITGNIAEVTYEGTAAYPDVVGAAIAHPVAHAIARPVAVAHPVAHAIRPVAHAV